MEKNKYLCPQCGSEMISEYQNPALNLICPKCGCKIATTRWERIDLDGQDYEIFLEKNEKPSIEAIRLISHLAGINYGQAKKLFEMGGSLLKSNALEIRKERDFLSRNHINFLIKPEFPY